MQTSSRRILRAAATAAAMLGGFALAGCAGQTTIPLVSAQFPPNVQSAQSAPQPLGSLPPGAANVSPAPGATHPQYLAFTFRGP